VPHQHVGRWDVCVIQQPAEVDDLVGGVVYARYRL